jgi:uncharacterized protein (TIGR04222 family)
MGHPWGLSGPEFLALYAGLLVLVCAAVLFAHLWAKSAEAPQPGLPKDLSVYEIAYLCGGVDRVADTAIAGLVDAGALRVDRARQVHATGVSGADDYQRRVLEWTELGRPVGQVRRNFHLHGTADPIASALREQGLLVPAGRLQVIKAAVWLFPALGVVGVARLLNGMAQNHPVGYLFLELAVTALVWAFLWQLAREPKRTRTGDRVVRGYKPNRISGTPEAAPGAQYAVAGTAAALVATGGMEAYPDRELAGLLIPPPTSGDSGGAAGGSGGDGGGGGGGGCGGGGA